MGGRLRGAGDSDVVVVGDVVDDAVDVELELLDCGDVAMVFYFTEDKGVACHKKTCEFWDSHFSLYILLIIFCGY